MIPKALVPLCALALSSLGVAQIPVPRPAPECHGHKIEVPPSAILPLQPRSVVIPTGGRKDLCTEYTYSGWKKTMRLYLGEEAFYHKEMIEDAVKWWNDALRGFNRKPVIEFAGVRPKNYSLPDDFWDTEYDNDYPVTRSLVKDGQSVIYFKGNGTDRTSGGFAHSRWDDNRANIESDMYINITDWKEYGPYLYMTEEVLDVVDNFVHVAVDSTYLTVLHEIGHALGLQHVPVSGNIMSYNYMPRMKSVWLPAMTTELFRRAELSYSLEGIFASDSRHSPVLSAFATTDPDRGSYLYQDDPDDMEIAMMKLFTLSAGLGEQDRMALLCAYEFSDWNH